MSLPSKCIGAVSSISSVGTGVYRVDIRVAERSTRFIPGQFLHLTLEAFDPSAGYWPESRVFSIASEPRQELLTIVYSVKGKYTRRMEKELYIGKEVWLKLPYGDFIVDEERINDGPVVLVAGGTGVAPFWPFLKKKRSGDGVVHLFYGIREPEHLLFGADLVSLAEQPWARLHLRVESGSLEGLDFVSGRLSVDDILSNVGKESTNANYYLSGPPGMIRLFREQLLERGIDSRRIHIDEWE
jgi:NAD(P)H-flavin reductase